MMRVDRLKLGVVAVVATLGWSPSAGAADAPLVAAADSAEQAHESKDIRAQVPILAYAYTAYGTQAGTMGAAAYGLGLAGNNRPTLGGGGTVWGSPVDRLTLIGDGSRDIFGNFAPSAALVVRLLGTPGNGWSLGAIGKFKVEGFAMGPNNEMESEIESGLLLSYAKYGWYLDLNAIGGVGMGDDGEVDAEGRVRFGHDIGRLVRVGVDGQARFRLGGVNRLPGGRTWDYAGGPQIMFGSKSFFAAVTAGPATMGIVDRTIGWTAIASVGGMTL